MREAAPSCQFDLFNTRVATSFGGQAKKVLTLIIVISAGQGRLEVFAGRGGRALVLLVPDVRVAPFLTDPGFILGPELDALV